MSTMQNREYLHYFLHHMTKLYIHFCISLAILVVCNFAQNTCVDYIMIGDGYISYRISYEG